MIKLNTKNVIFMAVNFFVLILRIMGYLQTVDMLTIFGMYSMIVFCVAAKHGKLRETEGFVHVMLFVLLPICIFIFALDRNQMAAFAALVLVVVFVIEYKHSTKPSYRVVDKETKESYEIIERR